MTTIARAELAHDAPAPGVLGLAERGLVPDALLRQGIRRMCAQRLAEECEGGLEAQSRRYAELIDSLRSSPVAIHTDAANAQHYELRLLLGEEPAERDEQLLSSIDEQLTTLDTLDDDQRDATR